MQPIPKPDLLDPDRILHNDRNNFFESHESRAHALETALHDSCSYAQQLWTDLDAARTYLLRSLPPEPSTGENTARTCASPVDADDGAGWDNWISAYSAVTSTLCGPHGDSGFGLAEAHREASLRRAHTPRIVAAHTSACRAGADPGESEPLPGAPHQSLFEPPGSPRQATPPTSPSRAMRTLSIVVLFFLTLRTRRHRTRTPA